MVTRFWNAVDDGVGWLANAVSWVEVHKPPFKYAAPIVLWTIGAVFMWVFGFRTLGFAFFGMSIGSSLYMMVGAAWGLRKARRKAKAPESYTSGSAFDYEMAASLPPRPTGASSFCDRCGTPHTSIRTAFQWHAMRLAWLERHALEMFWGMKSMWWVKKEKDFLEGLGLTLDESERKHLIELGRLDCLMRRLG